MADTKTVSVIMPIYNSEKYLQECLDSIFAQTYQDFEIIAVNDGSTDGSLDILRRNAKAHKNISVVDQKNHGQGYARNRALERAKGRYILFVDSDDKILPDLLEKTVSLAYSTKADLVHFYWQIMTDDGGRREKALELNIESFSDKAELSGADCEQYLAKRNHFVWDALYKNKFLQRNKVRFGEGYIYEDSQFVVMAACYAEKIVMLNEPLYEMRINTQSTTRSRFATDVHYKDFLVAVGASLDALRPRTPYAQFRLSAYFLEKFIIYYRNRVPRQYKQNFLRGFIDIIHNQTITLPTGMDYKFMRRCVQSRIFLDKKYQQFHQLLLVKLYILPMRSRIISFLKSG